MEKKRGKGIRKTRGDELGGVEREGESERACGVGRLITSLVLELHAGVLWRLWACGSGDSPDTDCSIHFESLGFINKNCRLHNLKNNHTFYKN